MNQQLVQQPAAQLSTSTKNSDIRNFRITAIGKVGEE